VTAWVLAAYPVDGKIGIGSNAGRLYLRP